MDDSTSSWFPGDGAAPVLWVAVAGLALIVGALVMFAMIERRGGGDETEPPAPDEGEVTAEDVAALSPGERAALRDVDWSSPLSEDLLPVSDEEFREAFRRLTGEIG